MKPTHERAKIALGEYQALEHTARTYAQMDLIDPEVPEDVPHPALVREKADSILSHLVLLYCEEKRRESMFQYGKMMHGDASTG